MRKYGSNRWIAGAAIVTGLGSFVPAAIKETYEKGAKHYIPKPSRFEDLKAAISVIIRTPWRDNWPILL